MSQSPVYSAKSRSVVAWVDSEVIDQRTPEEIREEWRQTATLSPSDFFIAAKRAGIITAQEALDAAKGNAPQGFIDLLSADPEVDEVEAQILFARMSVVERNHPYVVSFANASNITPEMIDQMFGWE